jgi:hypothetical protein
MSGVGRSGRRLVVPATVRDEVETWNPDAVFWLNQDLGPAAACGVGEVLTQVNADERVNAGQPEWRLRLVRISMSRRSA